MFQRGPGEGYHAAKDDALAIDPSLRCTLVRDERGRTAGFIVRQADGRSIGHGTVARDAWSAAFAKLSRK